MKICPPTDRIDCQLEGNVRKGVIDLFSRENGYGTSSVIAVSPSSSLTSTASTSGQAAKKEINSIGILLYKKLKFYILLCCVTDSSSTEFVAKPKSEVHVANQQNQNSQGNQNGNRIQNSYCKGVRQRTQNSEGSLADISNVYRCNFRFTHIRLIKWNNEKGETQRFFLMDKIAHKWHDIGQLLDF